MKNDTLVIIFIVVLIAFIIAAFAGWNPFIKRLPTSVTAPASVSPSVPTVPSFSPDGLDHKE